MVKPAPPEVDCYGASLHLDGGGFPEWIGGVISTE